MIHVNGSIQRYPLLRITLALGIGIAIETQLLSQVSPWVWIGFMVVSMLLARLLRNELAKSSCLLWATIALGGFLARTSRAQNLPTLPQGESHFEAVITDIPIQKGKTWRCDIRIMRLNNHLLRHPLLLKASILNSPQHDMHLAIGQGLVADAMLEPLRNTPQQPHFNYALWLKRQGYVGETFIPYWQLRTQKLPLSLPFWQRLQLKLHCIRAKMLCYLHGLAPNTMENALITALILGEKRALPRTLKDDFNMAGASHILALSGLHIGIIFSLLTRIFRRSTIALTLAIIALWAFTFLIGLPISAVRSAIMLSIYCITFILQREDKPLNALALSACIILVANPVALFDAGFQLSFMAVLGIAIVYRPLSNCWKPQLRPLRWAWELTCVTLAAQLFTFPLVLYYFGRISPYFLLSNFVVIPATTGLLYLAIALLVSTPIHGLQLLVYHLMLQIAQGMTVGVRGIVQLPGAQLPTIYTPLSQTILLYVALFALVGAWYKLQAKREDAALLA